MKKRTLPILFYCCSLLVSLSVADAVIAATADPQPSITVTGTGEVEAKPDMARVNIGVVTQAQTASASLKQNTEAVEKVFATLGEHDIAEDDIQTSNFSIAPQYDYNRQGQPPRLIGYRVSNDVRVTVRRIDDLGVLLDAVVTAGSNQINNVMFQIDETESLQDAARRLAMADARRKATLYAEEAGVRLGSVQRVEDFSGPVAMPQATIAMAAEARAVPIAPGQLTIRQMVRVTYAIETGQ